MPGVGEKTAAKLVHEFGSVEELVTRVDELKGKLKENLVASVDQLALNKELARIVHRRRAPGGARRLRDGRVGRRRRPPAVHLARVPDALRAPGGRAADAAKPDVDVAELDLREIAADELPAVLASGAPQGVRLYVEEDRARGIAVSTGGAQAAYAAAAPRSSPSPGS